MSLMLDQSHFDEIPENSASNDLAKKKPSIKWVDGISKNTPDGQ